jgi:hypothetical protein
VAKTGAPPESVDEPQLLCSCLQDRWFGLAAAAVADVGSVVGSAGGDPRGPDCGNVDLEPANFIILFYDSAIALRICC